MTHALVTQLRFTRSEWVRGLEGVSAEEATRRFGPMNCVSWMIGHLAWQEQRYWLQRAQGKTLVPNVECCGYGQPASTPALDEMWSAWRTITAASDEYLDRLTPDLLLTHFDLGSTSDPESVGTRLLRTTYHYWFHLGESQAIRQLLGHAGLPDFVGEISKAPYRRETA